MNEEAMIDDLINMLDSGMKKGVGHVNVEVTATDSETKNVQTMGCSDCSSSPLACSVPTLHQGLEDYEKMPEE